MLDFVSVLSRYYFVFLIGCFVFSAVKFMIRKKEDGRAAPVGQKAVTILFAAFAFGILAFDENLMRVDWGSLAFGALVLGFLAVAPVLVKRVYKRSCPIITNTMVFLLGLGFVVLYRLNPDFALRQFFVATAGFGASLLIPSGFRIFSQFERLEKLYMLGCFALVGIVAIADVIARLTGLPIVAVDAFGAARWLSIAGVSFQPSEFVKPVFVLYLACAFRTRPSAGKLIFTSAESAAIIGILVLQRDLGGALMFFAVFMVMFYVTTGNRPLIGAGFAAIAVASVAAYQIFPHLRVRVAAWHDPWAVIDNQGFQITQSLFAIGTWGAFGAGLGRGLPWRIPVVERDVIFSAISEEFGWLFGLLLIAVYGILLFQGVSIARRSKRPLYAMMTLGFTVFLTFQAFVAIGGNIKLIPMTGITLPFVSYGGSSVFVSVLMAGMLNWLNGQINEKDRQEKVEDDAG